MSLYNMLFKENPDADYILDILNLKREDFGRFRDIYLNAKGTEIIVYTRCGGFNRDDYEIVFEHMKQHPNYIKDYDDDYDNTYCYFVFSIPEDYICKTMAMATGEDPMTIKEKFNKEIEEMDDPNSEAYKRAEQIAKIINDGINENPNGGIIKL